MTHRFLTTLKSGLRTRGAAMLLVILFFVGISVSILQMVTLVAVSELRLYNGLATSKFAYVAAEAGVEDIFYRMITERTLPATETLALNGATTTVSIVNVSATEIDIYSHGIAKTQVRKLYMKAMKNVSVSLPYGAQVGIGGITLKNNSRIDGIGLANGDVYSNGQISGAPGVEITGNAISSSMILPDMTASSTACVADENVGRTNPNIDFAQSFTISTSTPLPLSKVSLYIKRNSNPTGANVRIVADNAGVPATTSLATQVLDNSLVNTTYGWVDIAFAIPTTLNPATKYWLIVDATQSAAKYWTWCRSGSDTYAGHEPYYKLDSSTSGAWTAVAGDMAFTITLGGGVSLIKDVDISGTAKADTIDNADIDTDAYYQSIVSSSVVGTSYPGSPTPPYVALPLSSSTIAQWKGEAAAGGTITGNCGVGGVSGCDTFPLEIGPKRINGNLHMDGGDVLTVNGTLYITGDLFVENAGTIKCALAFLGNSCVVIVDGYARIRGGGLLEGSGFVGSFVMILSTKQGCLGTGSGVGCTTNDSAIAIENNVDGALFYTTDSLIDISNGAVVTAVVGYQLQLQNLSEINYDPEVASLSFAATATTTTGAWNANRWNEY